MKIPIENLPRNVTAAIRKPDPLQGEDIFVEDEAGNLLAVIIQPKAYKFLLGKIEQREDEIDAGVFETYEGGGKSLGDLMRK